MYVYLTAILIGGLLGVLIYLFNLHRKHSAYWKNRGYAYKKPWPLMGNISLLQLSPNQIYEDCYLEFTNEKLVGVFEMLKPTLLVRDPAIIETILTKEFNNFMDRGIPVDEEVALVDSGLFTLTGSKWKAIRSKLTPTFSSGRLKAMMGQMLASAENLLIYLDEKSGTDVESRDLMFMFSTDVIASCAFGIDAKTMRNPDSEFRKKAKEMFRITAIRFIRILVMSNFPSIARYFKMTFTPWDIANYFAKIIRDTFNYRTKNNVSRSDFVQLLLQLRDKGYVEWTTRDPDDDYLEMNKNLATTEAYEMTEPLMISQAFSFLSAGSEPIANTMTFTAYELSKNIQVQEILREEVNAVISKHGALTYEALKDMVYLEQCILETLRMYPVAIRGLRLCTKTCILEDKFVIEEGTQVIIPVAALHRDPNYFPEPMSFKPERFGPGSSFSKGLYLPFGQGPRMCIAMRFAMFEMKAGLASLFHHYKVLPSPKTKEIKMSKLSLFSVPDHGVYLTFVKDHPDDCFFCSTEPLVSHP